MAKNKKAQILAAIMCASTVACVYPTIPAYADEVGTITIGDTTYQVVGTSDNTGKFIVDKNGNFGVLTNNANTYEGQTNLTSDDYVFNVGEDGTLNAAGINIADGRLVITPATGDDQSGGISFLKGRIIMDASGDFSIKDDELSNVFSVDSEEGHVKTEGHIEASKYIKTDEYIEAAGNITSTGGDIQSEKGDVLSFNNDLDEEISLNEVGYNTQKISYAGGATIVDSDVNISNHKLTKLAAPTDNLDAANKQYVDDKILNTYTPGDGINIEKAPGEIKKISVKNAENSGLTVDENGVAVNAGNGLGINTETGALQVKAGKGLQINSATKELEAFSSDPNIIIDETTGITLNPELTNMTSISFEGSDVSISASGINAGNKEIKNVLINENSTDDVAVNKRYVDNAVKNATGKTYTEGQGIAVDNNGNTISVKTTDENSGLKFTTDGKMSVAIGEQSGLVIDNNALSVNTGDGLTVEDNKVKIKLDPNDKNLIFGTNGVLSLGQDLKVSTVTATGNISGNTINGVTIENLNGNDAKINGIQLSTLQGAGTTYTEGSGIDIGEDTISVQTAKNDNNENVSGLDFDKKGGLKVVSADSNIQVGTNGIKLNPELTNITSIDGAAISQVGTEGLKIANVTLEKGSVSAEAGSDVTIGVPAEDNIYSLKKVADKVSGIDVDEEGNIIGGIAGWSYNNETNTATIGTSENGITINGNTKDITGTNGNATLNGVGIFTGTQEADNKDDILLSSGEQEINVTDMNTDVTNLKTVTTGISYNEGNDLTTVDNNVQINKNLTVGGTSTFGIESTQTSISNNGVTVADNATEQAAGTTDVKIGEGDKYSLRAIGDKIDGLNIDEDIDLRNIKGITRTGDETIGYTTNIAEDDFAVGDKFDVDNATGNVTGGTYNGVEIKTTPNTSTETPDDVDAVINGANVNE